MLKKILTGTACIVMLLYLCTNSFAQETSSGIYGFVKSDKSENLIGMVVSANIYLPVLCMVHKQMRTAASI